MFEPKVSDRFHLREFRPCAAATRRFSHALRRLEPNKRIMGRRSPSVLRKTLSRRCYIPLSRAAIPSVEGGTTSHMDYSVADNSNNKDAQSCSTALTGQLGCRFLFRQLSQRKYMIHTGVSYEPVAYFRVPAPRQADRTNVVFSDAHPLRQLNRFDE